jgi:hypothetical protein
MGSRNIISHEGARGAVAGAVIMTGQRVRQEH